MIWNLTGNEWFDKYVRQFMNFTSELDSSACHYSPLEQKDIDEFRKVMTRINKINNRIAKRIIKQRKKNASKK